MRIKVDGEFLTHKKIILLSLVLFFSVCYEMSRDLLDLKFDEGE
ncbi:hypothetical protein BvCms1816_01465 [Escherichia coli]|nr:hypothetical protein BvCms1816_01465 [Escherichia coli]